MEKNKIYGAEITGKYICESKKKKKKNESVYFYSCCQAKLSPRFLSLPIISPDSVFHILSPAERGEIMGTEKMSKIKLARVLVTSFDKFHVFAAFTYLVSVLVRHN